MPEPDAVPPVPAAVDGLLNDGERAFDDLLSEAHLLAAHQLPDLLARHGARLGVTDVLLYLAYLQQDVLVPFVGSQGPGLDETVGPPRSGPNGNPLHTLLRALRPGRIASGATTNRPRRPRPWARQPPAATGGCCRRSCWLGRSARRSDQHCWRRTGTRADVTAVTERDGHPGWPDVPIVVDRQGGQREGPHPCSGAGLGGPAYPGSTVDLGRPG